MSGAMSEVENYAYLVTRGSLFANLARHTSQGPNAANGGDLGFIELEKLSPALQEELSYMQVGDVTDLILLKDGVAVLQLAGQSAAPASSLITTDKSWWKDLCGNVTIEPPMEVLNEPVTGDLRQYLNHAKQRILRNWYRYPPRATLLPDKKGQVTIEFSILKNGNVSDERVFSSSGDSNLDFGAIRALRITDPFVHLPNTVNEDRIKLRMRFSYGKDDWFDGLIPDIEQVKASPQISPDKATYMNQTLNAIRRNWYRLVPMSARPPANKKGRVTAEFIIQHDGIIFGENIVSSSGDDELDKAVIDAIKATNNLPAFPSTVSDNSIKMRISFAYNPNTIPN